MSGPRSLNVFSGDLLLPVMVIKERALAHNLEVMARFCEQHRVSLAPHAKTTMARALVERPLRAGAWGMTAGTVAQARALSSWGVERILLANELVEEAAVRWVVDALLSDPSLRLYCLADSIAAVEIMSDAVSAHHGSTPVLDVLVELGVAGGRTGCRTIQDAIAVAIAVSEADGLRLAGVECYEGIISEPDEAVTLERVDALLGGVRELTEALDARGVFARLDEIIVSAGGSAYPDRVVERLGHPWRLSRDVRVVLRSGCYLTHDSGHYRRLSPFDGRRREGGAVLLPPSRCGGQFSRVRSRDWRSRGSGSATSRMTSTSPFPPPFGVGTGT